MNAYRLKGGCESDNLLLDLMAATLPHLRPRARLHRRHVRGGVQTVVVLVLCMVAVPAFATHLNAAAVVRSVHKGSLDALRARHASHLAKVRAEATTLLPNPTLAWSQEAFAQPDTEREDSVSVHVPFDFSPRRRATTLMAQSETSEAEAQAFLTRGGAVEKGLVLFYQSLAARKLVEERRVLEGDLNEAARIMTLRVDQGTGSGYDESLVSVAHALATSARMEAEATFAKRRDELAIYLNITGSPVTLEGSLQVVPTSLSTTSPQQKPSLLALDRATALLKEAQAASESFWIPPFDVSAGPRRRSGPEAGWGYSVEVSIELPVFSRGQDVRSEAEGRLRLAEVKSKLLTRNMTTMEARALATIRTASAALKRLRKSVHDPLLRLHRAAQVGYREGRLTLAQLLDAQQARTDVGLQTLHLALRAKIAEVRLRRSRGEYE